MITRLRRSEQGEALLFVLMLSLVVMIVVGSASATLIAQIHPTTVTVQSNQAYAAAEAGIEDFTAQVNARCPNAVSFSCTWLSNGLTSNPEVSNPRSQAGTLVPGADGATTNEAFDWTVRYSATGFVRVISVGQALTGSGKPTITKALVADLGATPSFNNFQYYTKFETFPADFVNSFYAARQVNITNSSAVSGSSLSGPGLLRWNGTCTYVSATATPTCDANHDTSICNDLYYPSDDGPGRGTDAAWNNSLRRPATTTQSAMGTDSSFAYYSEQGTFTPTSGSPVAETHNDVCDSTFEPNMVMNGPIYSQDAYLIDRGKDTGNSKNSMPNFNGPAYSMWNGVINAVQQAKGANQGYDRAYPNTDGQISTSLAPQPVYTPDKLDLPANADTAKGLATCTYTGPTRILIKQSIAYITSPETPTSPAPPGPSYCYANTGSFSNPSGGVAVAQVPIASTLIYVQNPTGATPRLATASNPIFNLSAKTAAPTATGSDNLAGTWTDNATYNPNQTCPATPAPAKRRNFDCETSKTTPPSDMATAISQAVDSTMKAGASSTSAMQTNLTNAITNLMSSASLTQPATFDTTTGYYYTVTVGTPTQTQTTTNPPTLSPADPFYQAGGSGSFTTTSMTASISIDRITCASLKKGACNSTTDTPIYKGTASGSSSSGTAATASASWPWFGAQSGPSMYTDPNNDITPYYDGYGDAYVEGTLKGSMTIIAEHDIVATNDITYNNTTLNTTTDGLALIADHNVRVYRPMTCTDNDSANATGLLDSHNNVLPGVGVCPDDLTGVFSTPLSWPLPNNYPATKYVPDNAPSMTNGGAGNIYATVFTLRGCFMVDNFYRGGIGYSANVYGGLYQYHRGPTSLPYQGRPYQGSKTKMPGVVLSYTYDNMRAGQTSNGGLRVPWIPNPVGRPTGSTRTWNVVNLATGS